MYGKCGIYKLEKNDILYFLHIRKTGGTTLMTLLDDHFDVNSILTEHDWHSLLPKMPKDFLKIRLVRGHFGYGLHRILPQKPIYITMLRDPTDRTVSDYEQSKRTANFEEIILPNTEIDEVIHSKNRIRFTNNQIHSLTLDREISDLTSLLTKQHGLFYLTVFALEMRSPNDPNDEELLQLAKKKILEFAFVGLSEKFEESLDLLCYTFGWRPIRNIINQNVADKKVQKKDLSKETIEGIQDCVKLDTQLYNYATQLFEERYSVMIKDLKERYQNSSVTNLSEKDTVHQLLEKHYENCYDNNLKPKVESLDYDFSHSMDGSGWYAREFLPDGNIIRWTGPETTATIDFPLLSISDYKIQIEAKMCLSSEILESLQLEVDNMVIDLKISKVGPMTIFEGIVPRNSIQGDKKFTRFIFRINRTIRPSSLDKNSSDKRLLGIAFSRIKLIPIKF